MNKSLKKIGLIILTISLFIPVMDNLAILTKTATAIAGTVFKFKLPPPPNRGIAGNRLGGASRILTRNDTQESRDSDRRLTALVPEYRNSKPELTKVWGLTADEHPTFWFYIPYAQDSIAQIDFTLRDGDNLVNQTVYKNAIPLPKQPGIVNFALPQTSKSLAIDKLYQWELKLTMKRQRDKEISVTGWVQRAGLSRELSDLIKQANPSRQAVLYAENGLWYDALSTLAKLRRDVPIEQLNQQPADLAIIQDWKNMLKSVDLDKLDNKLVIR